MSGGILAGLNDPKLMARLRERERIAERVAEQMGVPLWKAMEALRHFEECECSCGQEIH